MKRISQLKRKMMLAVAALCFLAVTNESLAAGQGGFLWHHSPFAGRPAPSYYQRYHYLNSRFPKYYGGFHARYFQDLGVPPGDIGLRGNGIYATPW